MKKLAFLAFLGLSACTVPQPDATTPRTVAAVDLARYAGTWHEAARFPQRFQDSSRLRCEAVTATYTARPDGRIGVVNRCRNALAGGIAGQGDDFDANEAEFAESGGRGLPRRMRREAATTVRFADPVAEVGGTVCAIDLIQADAAQKFAIRGEDAEREFLAVSACRRAVRDARLGVGERVIRMRPREPLRQRRDRRPHRRVQRGRVAGGKRTQGEAAGHGRATWPVPVSFSIPARAAVAGRAWPAGQGCPVLP